MSAGHVACNLPIFCLRYIFCNSLILILEKHTININLEYTLCNVWDEAEQDNAVAECVPHAGGQSLPEFFHTMRRQFTSAEWEFITAPPTDKQQLAMFYRFWVSILSWKVLVCMYVSMETESLWPTTKLHREKACYG